MQHLNPQHPKSTVSRLWQQLTQKTHHLLLAGSVSACLWADQALAALPTVDASSHTNNGTLMDTIRAYIYDAAILLGLILCTIAFIMVAASSIASFKEARERETWGKFATTVVVGVCLVVSVAWLADEAQPILSTSLSASTGTTTP